MHVGHQPKRRVIDYYVASGVKSVLVLGVLGEADRLSDAERERIQEIALEHTRGRVRVIVGVTHRSTTVAAKRARAAAQAGASAVLRWWQARYNYTIRCQSEVRLRKGCFYRTTNLSAKPIYGRGNPCAAKHRRRRLPWKLSEADSDHLYLDAYGAGLAPVL